MPIKPTTIAAVKSAVYDDVVEGLGASLTPDPTVTTPFSINLMDSELLEPDIVAASDSVVAVPWSFSCVHTGYFLDIPPTFVAFELRGATFVTAVAEDPGKWIYNRFIDYLCALHHIGVQSTVRPALTAADYVNWDQLRAH
jgi:hypothetical protein